MNQEERDWLEWLKRAQDGVVTQRQAAEKMGVSDRWGAQAVGAHEDRWRRRCGARSTRPDVEPADRQADAGACHGAAEASGVARLRADVRQRAVGETTRHRGEQGDSARKLGETHFWRARRSGYGELVQWDTSNHDWLEGRGETVRYLVRMIDDATSRSAGSFVQHDGTRENMGVLWQYVERQGRMVDVYTDRAAMFMVTPRAKESAQQRRESDRLTQIGRGLRELGIGWIPAYSPQAKAYASYCTSCEPWKTFSGKRRRLASLTPWALHGGLGPGFSYNQSFRSFTG